MNWGIDDPNFSCGWVSPDGHTFSCAWKEHEKLARYLLLHIVNGLHTHRAKRLLLQAGWMMISAGDNALIVQTMTSEQNRRLGNNIVG